MIAVKFLNDVGINRISGKTHQSARLGLMHNVPQTHVLDAGQNPAMLFFFSNFFFFFSFFPEKWSWSNKE